MSKPVGLEISKWCMYVGEVIEEGGKRMRHGLGVQVLVEEKEGKQEMVCRYEGEWENDKMHGNGKMDMGDESYEGEFYQGEANGRIE